MKKSPIVICHLIVMIALFLCATFATVMFLGGFEFAVEGKARPDALLTGFSTLLVMLMLFMGILYLLKEYSKQAAIFYKAFLLILVLINMMNTSFNFSLLGVITAIVADGTVGLDVRGKYIDKSERGSR